jgi:hypothetical protein
MDPPAPDSVSRQPRGFSLRDRLLLLTLGIVIVLVGLTQGIIDVFLRQQIRREVAAELVTTGTVFERFLDLRAGWIRRQSTRRGGRPPILCNPRSTRRRPGSIGTNRTG